MLAMFPLKLGVYPGEYVNLHIFEPRYKQLINECKETGMTFGIPTFVDGKLKDFATEVRLIAINQVYPKGEMDIHTEGLEIVKVDKFYRQAPDRLYGGADIERLENSFQPDFLLSTQLIELLEEMFDLLQVDKEVNPDAQEFVSYDYAHSVGLSIQQEYELLTLLTESARQEYLLSHLEGVLPKLREMEELRRKVQMNGHFKNVLPPKL